ncbi:hypothetical protein B9N43_13295 [Denitratisoma sp. DHT3]|uniref:bifunctional aminoglycoside phosphotransferase/ATP-binding protein n=1 Tax=Denitratisoma sp. DHT3 TaxID=1981880 RepID=UPI0011986418|nr:bifunctional aminoglycoside phosphotransferase/ATP-binding protein [Denitratisoma sp. DHT3]QDX82133.1 hypothetical protein B9N43_13295 [Denitratisoma sp. DHT3]
MTLSPLIAALLDPARYDAGTTRVDLVETHISWLLLAGTRAYKIKKPIVLPFLDYGTLDRRRACCEAELRLNRRYAPQLYRGVARITGSSADPRWNGSGPVLEYAVEMERFDEAARLDHVCARDALTPAHLDDLAATVARCHAEAPAVASGAPWGTPQQVHADAEENFAELRQLMTPDDQPLIEELARWSADECLRRAADFARRHDQGRVRECHGDLHLGNLVLLGERVLPFDCIEFNEGFRWIDVASEVAFTYVDLLDHGKPDLAAWWLNAWLAASGDFDALAVLRFYAVYRALVRAKVAAIRAAQEGGEPCQARDYLALARRLSRPPAPTLTITWGLSGSGKSRASARRLQADADAATIRLRSDVERKRLFGLSALDHSGSPLDGGLYTAAAHQHTYQRLAHLAERILAAGWSVIVDAAFLRRRERDAFHALARTARVPFAILACQASPAQLRERVAHRAAQGADASEATLAVLERQLHDHDPLAADERPWVVPNQETS